MKKEHVETLVDHFVDENGDTRYFVIAAVSEVIPSGYEVCDDYNLVDVAVKGLRIGWAICNPIDKFNEQMGMQIAIGRARKNSTCALYSTELGYINTKVVKAFLEQEAKFFKENPATRIAGYKRKK